MDDRKRGPDNSRVPSPSPTHGGERRNRIEYTFALLLSPRLMMNRPSAVSRTLPRRDDWGNDRSSNSFHAQHFTTVWEVGERKKFPGVSRDGAPRHSRWSRSLPA